jgi:hypothetical protein
MTPDEFFGSDDSHADRPAARTGVVANIGAGTNDVIAGLAGMPVDAMEGGLNLASRGIKAVTGYDLGQLHNSVGGSNSIKSALGLVGADPRTVEPGNDFERYARAASSGATSMLVPGLGAAALPEAAGALGAVQSGLRTGASVPGLVSGGVGGVTGQVAADAVPAAYKPAASLLGNLAGGVGTAAVGAGVRAGYNAAADRLGAATRSFAGKAAPILDANGNPVMMSDITGLSSDAYPVMAKPGQVQMAGAKLNAAAADPVAARAALANPPGPQVPGVAPTTYQITDDAGLGQHERQAATNNPGLWIARQEQQNAGRIAAVKGAALPGDPNSAPAVFQAHLSALDAATEAEHSSLLDQAQQAKRAVGGSTVGTEASSAGMQSGSALADPLIAAAERSKEAYRQVYGSMSPEATVLADPMRTTAARLSSSVGYDTPLTDTEKGIYNTARMMPKVIPFSEQNGAAGTLQQFRSRITSAMRAARVDPDQAVAYRRLTQMLGAVDASMQATIEGMTPEAKAAMMDRLGQAYSSSPPVSPSDGSGGGALASGSGAGGTARPNAGLGGDAATGTGRPGGFGGDSGLPVGAADELGPPRGWISQSSILPSPKIADNLKPNFTAEDAVTYRLGNAMRAEHARMFERAPGVGEVLAPGPTKGTYKNSTSQAPGLLLGPGSRAAERARAYLEAGGSKPAAEDYLASEARRATEQADGTIDPRKLHDWLDARRETMSAFPELTAKLQTAASARQAMTDAATRSQAAREAFVKSAVKPFLGSDDPVAVVGRILEATDGRARMQDLARRTAGNRDARAGLQQAAVQYILRKATSNSDLLKSDVFQTLVKKAPLDTIFAPDQVKSLRDVAASLKQANRSVVGTKIAGQSNTAQDLAGGGHTSMNSKLLTQMAVMEAVGGALGGFAEHAFSGGIGTGIVGGGSAAAAGIGLAALKSMRDAGLQRVDQLAAMAALHPPLARVLMSTPSPANRAGTLALLRRNLVAVTAGAALNAGRSQ